MLRPGASTQAAAVNQDGTINGSDHPAPRGSVVSLFGTGFGNVGGCATGATNPDGPASLAPGVEVTINSASGAHPVVTYAGGAPGLLCGVAQVNIVVPDDTPSGDFFVTPAMKLPNGAKAQGQLYVSIAVK